MTFEEELVFEMGLDGKEDEAKRCEYCGRLLIHEFFESEMLGSISRIEYEFCEHCDMDDGDIDESVVERGDE